MNGELRTGRERVDLARRLHVKRGECVLGHIGHNGAESASVHAKVHTDMSEKNIYNKAGCEKDEYKKNEALVVCVGSKWELISKIKYSHLYTYIYT